MKYHTFQPRFHAGIRARRKVTTIRASSPVQVGERFALKAWSGEPYRSKQELLGTATCTRRFPVRVHGSGVDVGCGEDCWKPMHEGFLHPFATGEGFADWAEMLAWFDEHHDLPLVGVMLHWDSFRPAEGAA